MSTMAIKASVRPINTRRIIHISRISTRDLSKRSRRARRFRISVPDSKRSRNSWIRVQSISVFIPCKGIIIVSGRGFSPARILVMPGLRCISRSSACSRVMYSSGLWSHADVRLSAKSRTRLLSKV